MEKALDFEESIWSPKYGLKGILDATVLLNINEGSSIQKQLSVIEIKSGKAYMVAHDAQTKLYSLLLSDRYGIGFILLIFIDIKIPGVVLYYIKTGDFKYLHIRHDDIRELIIRRNDLAFFLNDMNNLPPMQQNAYKCGQCNLAHYCMVAHKVSKPI